VSPPPTLTALFVAFLQIGLSAFGGGLVWVHRVVVERRGWLPAQDFADILSLAQVMPGPNIASLTVCIGARLRGWRGALAALAGFMVIPVAVGSLGGALLLQHADGAILQNTLTGVAATAAGLIIGTGVRLLLPYRGEPAAWIVAALACGLIVFARLPLPVVLLTMAPISIALAAYRARRAP
jgi:chromate transporter